MENLPRGRWSSCSASSGASGSSPAGGGAASRGGGGGAGAAGGGVGVGGGGAGVGRGGGAPAALEGRPPAVRRFARKGHPIPRLFSPGLITASADSFPVEFAEIRAARVVLHGDDPFGGVRVGRDHLRLQLEREIKEKMMRLREAYVLLHDRASALRRALARSYPAFAALFRGGLVLMGRPGPSHNQEVVAAFCEAAGLDRGPFDEVARLRQGGEGSA